MNEVSLADFSELIQYPFPIAAGDLRLRLTLISATAVGGGVAGGRRPFSLMFRGPVHPILAQATYEFEHPRHGAMAIFIVPIAADGEGVTYEAVFG